MFDSSMMMFGQGESGAGVSHRKGRDEPREDDDVQKENKGGEPRK